MGGFQCNQPTTNWLVGLHRGMVLYQELSIVPVGVVGHSGVAVVRPAQVSRSIDYLLYFLLLFNNQLLHLFILVLLFSVH